MPELAVIIPTRGRPENVRKVIGAWDFTNAWDVADLVLVADADDPEIQGYRAIADEFLEGCPPGTPSPLTLMTIPSWLPMVRKLDLAARTIETRYFALGFAGDDHLPQTIGWAKRYLEVLRELGTGMVYGDDGYQGSNLSTEWAITSDVVHALSRMVPAPVEHMYCDNAMMDLFGGAGALRHLPEVRIEHMHPIAGKAENDDQYKRVNHRDQFRSDRALYETWKRSRMADDIATVRALRPGRPETRPGRDPDRPKGTLKRSPVVRPKGRSMTQLPIPRRFKMVRGATPDEIGLTLADLALQVPYGQAIVELGVFQARTALLMAWGASQGNHAHVWGIDAWDLEGNTYAPPFTDPGTRNWAYYNVMSHGFNSGITLIHDFSENVARDWSGPGIGLLFIDADHSKEGALKDIRLWAPHLAEGAVIAVDDYGHPDWPGVAEAVDELVAEGFLAPIEIYHERLAVTRLALGDPDTEVSAITSEGVSPEPYQATESSVLQPLPVPPIEGGTVAIGEAETVTLEPKPYVGGGLVHEDELSSVAPGTTIEELNTGQLRALARKRGIKLGARKDLRDSMLQALRDGQ